MSTPLPSRSSGPHATKQLLDELDALMQRMLALPVNELGDELENAADGDAQEAPAATATATAPPPPAVERPEAMTAAEPEPPLPLPPVEVFGTRRISPHPPAPALAPPHWQETSRPTEGADEDTTEAPASAAFPPTGFWPHPALRVPEDLDAPARSEPAPPDPPVKPSVRPAAVPALRRLALFGNRTTPLPRPLAGWWLRSVLWSNRTFDHYAGRLGRPGRWLQGHGGRTLLGWLGLGLLGAAVVWGLSNGFGWTW